MGFIKILDMDSIVQILKKQAKRWTLTKKNNHIVNVYTYTENLDLNCKVFEQMSDEWLDFVVSSRRGITHTYDIVERPMAWNYVYDFARDLISRTAFCQLVKLKYPMHQIVFLSKEL